MAGRRDAGARARPTPRRRRGRALGGGDDGAAASRDRGGRVRAPARRRASGHQTGEHHARRRRRRSPVADARLRHREDHGGRSDRRHAGRTQQRRDRILAGLRGAGTDHVLANGPVDRRPRAGAAVQRAAHRRAAFLGRRRRAAVRAGHVRRTADAGAPGHRRRAPRADRREGARAVTGPAVERRGRASRRARRWRDSPREAPARSRHADVRRHRDPVRRRGARVGAGVRRWATAQPCDALGLGRERVALDRSDSGLRVGRLQRHPSKRRSPRVARAAFPGPPRRPSRRWRRTLSPAPSASTPSPGPRCGSTARTPASTRRSSTYPSTAGPTASTSSVPICRSRRASRSRSKPGQTFKRRYTLPGGGAD